MRQNFDSIDLAKFIACIFIVALHANALYDISPILNTLICEGIARLGVPFFFTASAFFFFRKPLTWEGTRKYCNRLLKLYIVWFVISLPKTVFDRFICSPYPFGETFFRFIRSFFVTSTFSGSWFIVSCIFCGLLFSKIEKLDPRMRDTVIVALSVIVYLWITLTSAYGKLMLSNGLSSFYKVYELFFSNPYCSILVGIPYFALGRYYAGKTKVLDKLKVRFYIVFFALSLVLLLFEVYYTNTYALAKSTDCYFMLLPCIYFLFPLLIQWTVTINRAVFLRNSSTIIFFSQFWLLFLCEFAEWALHTTIPWFVKFIFTIILGILLSLLILCFKEKKGFRWLKYLY